MKRIISVAIAISLFFCFSITSFSVPNPSSMDSYHSKLIIKLSDAPKEAYDFFYNWNKLPSNKRLVYGDNTAAGIAGVFFVELLGLFSLELLMTPATKILY